MLASAWSKTFGLSLDAQPAAFTCAVNFFAVNFSPSPLIIGEVGGHMRSSAGFTLVLLFGAAVALVSREPQADPRMKNAFRRAAENGWTYVHLEGSPAQIVYQHGYLLAPEIRDAQRVIALELTQDTKRSWNFFRDAAQSELWPHIEQQYRDELEGIAGGLNAHGVRLDVWDVVALNAFLEWN